MNRNNQTESDEIRQAEEARKITEKLIKREKGPRRYINDKERGRGAMGVINEVYDQDLKRIAAMKIIQPQLIDMEQKFSAFVAEARLTAQLEHPNIVPIHHLGSLTDKGLPFYTMKLVEGEPLDEIIEKIAAEEPAYITKYNRHLLLNIFRSVCNAISYAHSHNVIHRDIKPENIMIGQFGEVLVMDWGLSKQLDADATAEPGDAVPHGLFENDPDIMKTQDGTIKGSPAYISPEQAYGDVDQVDKHTDIFLLGSTLYHMFTHTPPYTGDDIMEIITKAEKCDFVPPRERNPKYLIPLALERIILKAMAPVKESRYDNVDQLIEDIDAFITGRRVSGRKVFSPGEDLIKTGFKTDECYVIVDGKVEVHSELNGKKISIATVGPGEIIGEMSGITRTVSSATVTALESTDTLIITNELLEEELQKLPPWLEQIIISMTKRVRTLIKQAHPLLMQEGAYPVICQLYTIYLSLKERQQSNVHISFSIKDVIDEIAINLGLGRIEIEKILTVLIKCGLCAFDKRNALIIPSMDEYGLFVDYCRKKYHITGGMIEIKKIDLTPDQSSNFQKIIYNLSQLFPEK